MLGWLKRNRGYNVCECGAQIEGPSNVCEKCAKQGKQLAQGYKCQENGHIFMVITFPTQPGMPKSAAFYEAKECPICLSKNIVKQETKRR